MKGQSIYGQLDADGLRERLNRRRSRLREGISIRTCDNAVDVDVGNDTID